MHSIRAFVTRLLFGEASLLFKSDLLLHVASLPSLAQLTDSLLLALNQREELLLPESLVAERIEELFGFYIQVVAVKSAPFLILFDIILGQRTFFFLSVQ